MSDRRLLPWDSDRRARPGGDAGASPGELVLANLQWWFEGDYTANVYAGGGLVLFANRATQQPATWSPVSGAAPDDGTLNGRRSGVWVPANGDLLGYDQPLATARFTHAALGSSYLAFVTLNGGPPANQELLASISGPGAGPGVQIRQTAALLQWFVTDGAGVLAVSLTAARPSALAHFYEFIVAAGSSTMFVDTVQVAADTINPTTDADSPLPLTLGARPLAPAVYDRRWPGPIAFVAGNPTPPTAPQRAQIAAYTQARWGW